MVVEELLNRRMEGEIVLEEDMGEGEGEDMDEAGQEEDKESSTRGTSSTSASTNSVVSSSYPPPSSPSASASSARIGIGGSRQQCGLPDHRVQAGCTSIVALLVGDDLFVANAGDSRAVLCRGGTAIALSEDHKPMQDRELERIRRAGGFVTEQGRVNGNLNLSRSIGDLKYKGNVALPAKEQMITAEPDLARITLVAEDEFLVLACDGVWDCMTNQECVDFVRARLQRRREEGREGEPVSKVAEQVVDACLAEDPRKTTGIGGDNMTCLIVQLKERQGPGQGGKRGGEGGGRGKGAVKEPRV